MLSIRSCQAVRISAMKTNVLARISTLLCAFVAASISVGALSVTRHSLTYQMGFDVSFPQCHGQLPSPGVFSIVGVNGGQIGTRNACLNRELTWAQRSSGSSRQAPVSVYVNTQDAGPGGGNWPKNNNDPISGYPVADRFGTCHGGNTTACAWQYGWNAAETDAMSDGIKSPLNYYWWLDVETSNSWQADRQLNRSVLTGMADYFNALGVPVGIYSTWYQWPRIAGTVSASNPLYALPEWVTGASTEKDAKSACWQGQFMPQGIVVLSQWYGSSSAFDVDLACPQSGFRKIRSPY